jgi:hypothetical protein
MKSDKSILLEIERMREIMGMRELTINNKYSINETLKHSGLQLIFEAKVPTLEYLERVFKGLGFEPKTAMNLADQAAENFDSAARNFFEVLEKEGLDDIGKIQRALADAGSTKLTDDVIDNALKLYFKNNPAIAKELLTSSSEFTKGILRNLPLDKLVPKDVLDDLNVILDANIDDLALFPDELQKIVDGLEGDPTLMARFNANDPEVVALYNGMRRQLELSRGLGNTEKNIGTIPVDTPVISKDGLTTNKEDADLDAELEKRNKEQEEIKKQKEKEKIKKQKIEDVKEDFLRLYNEQLKDIYTASQRFLSYIGIGSYSSFIEGVEKTLGETTIEELESGVAMNKLKTYLAEKIKALPTKDQKEIGEVNSKIDQWIESIPFGIGKTYKKTIKYSTGTLALLGAVWLTDFVSSLFTQSGKGLPTQTWINIKESLIGLRNNIVPYKYPDCLSLIEGYYYLEDVQQRMVAGTKLTCDNVNPEKPEFYASYIKFKKGGSVYDPTQNKTIAKSDSFIVTIGGKDIEFPVGEKPTPVTPIPPTPGTEEYTYDPAGFKKWVEKQGGTYGNSGGYLFQDNIAMKRDSSGKWNEVRYDATKKTYLGN